MNEFDLSTLEDENISREKLIELICQMYNEANSTISMLIEEKKSLSQSIHNMGGRELLQSLTTNPSHLELLEALHDWKLLSNTMTAFSSKSRCSALQTSSKAITKDNNLKQINNERSSSAPVETAINITTTTRALVAATDSGVTSTSIIGPNNNNNNNNNNSRSRGKRRFYAYPHEDSENNIYSESDESEGRRDVVVIKDGLNTAEEVSYWDCHLLSEPLRLHSPIIKPQKSNKSQSSLTLDQFLPKSHHRFNFETTKQCPHSPIQSAVTVPPLSLASQRPSSDVINIDNKSRNINSNMETDSSDDEYWNAVSNYSFY